MKFAPHNALRVTRKSQVPVIFCRQVAAVQRNSFTSLQFGTPAARRNRYNRYRVTRRCDWKPAIFCGAGRPAPFGLRAVQVPRERARMLEAFRIVTKDQDRAFFEPLTCVDEMSPTQKSPG